MNIEIANQLVKDMWWFNANTQNYGFILCEDQITKEKKAYFGPDIYPKDEIASIRNIILNGQKLTETQFRMFITNSIEFLKS